MGSAVPAAVPGSVEEPRGQTPVPCLGFISESCLELAQTCELTKQKLLFGTSHLNGASKPCHEAFKCPTKMSFPSLFLMVRATG